MMNEYPADQHPILTLGCIFTMLRFSANGVNLGTGVLKGYSDVVKAHCYIL